MPIAQRRPCHGPCLNSGRRCRESCHPCCGPDSTNSCLGRPPQRPRPSQLPSWSPLHWPAVVLTPQSPPTTQLQLPTSRHRLPTSLQKPATSRPLQPTSRPLPPTSRIRPPMSRPWSPWCGRGHIGPRRGHTRPRWGHTRPYPRPPMPIWTSPSLPPDHRSFRFRPWLSQSMTTIADSLALWCAPLVSGPGSSTHPSPGP